MIHLDKGWYDIRVPTVTEDLLLAGEALDRAGPGFVKTPKKLSRPFVVTTDSAKSVRKAVERLGRYFNREFSYDCARYSHLERDFLVGHSSGANGRASLARSVGGECTAPAALSGRMTSTYTAGRWRGAGSTLTNGGKVTCPTPGRTSGPGFRASPARVRSAPP